MRPAIWVGAVAVLVLSSPAIGQEKKPEILVKLEGHRGGVSALAFDPHDPFIATGSGNGIVRLWDLKTGDMLLRPESTRHNGARINHVGFSAEGKLLSGSSKNANVVWDISPPKEELKTEEKKDAPPPKKGSLAEKLKDFGEKIRNAPVYEDSYSTDPAKLGTVTGDGKRIYYSASEGARVTINSSTFSEKVGTATGDELHSNFIPWAIDAIPDGESTLVAMYGSSRGGDKKWEPAIAFVGLGDGRVIARGIVPPPVVDRPVTIGFSPDGKWLVACNGERLMYWHVPGSQVVTADPRVLVDAPAYTAAAGPNGRIAFASPPEPGKKVKVTITDVTGTQPRTLVVYDTDIEKVSALAFSPDGKTLAVADDPEGVVQVWALPEK